MWTGDIKYLGLQLGRSVGDSDDLSQCKVVRSAVCKSFGKDHLDSDRRENYVVIKDENTEEDRVAMIDFEDYYLRERRVQT